MKDIQQTTELDDPGINDNLHASAQALRQWIDRHCCLIDALLGEGDAGCLAGRIDRCPQRSREQAFKSALLEAIEELETSRKSFKSKRLEALRKRLLQVLIDND